MSWPNQQLVVSFLLQTVGGMHYSPARASKLELQEGHLYIRAPKANQGVNIEPSLPMDLVPDSEKIDLEAFLSRRNPRAVWTSFFYACQSSKASDASSSRDWEKVTPPPISAYNDAEATLQTPKGLKIGPFFSEALNDLLPDSEVVTGIEKIKSIQDLKDGVKASSDRSTDAGSAELEFLELLAEEWPKLGRNFTALGDDVTNLARTGVLFRDETKDALTGLKEFLSEVELKLQIVDARIGKDGLVSDYAGLTLWEAIRQLQTRDDMVENVLTGFNGQINGFDALLQAQGLAVDTASSDATEARRMAIGLNDEFEEFLKGYSTNLRKLQDRIKEAKNANQKSSTVRKGKASRVTIDLEDVDEDRPMDGRSVSKPNTTAKFSEVGAIAARVSKLELHLEEVRSSPPHEPAEILDNRLRIIEAKIGGDSFKLNDKHFGSSYDLELWIEQSEVTSCGHFWDLFSCLVAMDMEKAQTGKSRADSTHSSARVKSTRAESDLIASMDHDWPACFFGSPDAIHVASREGGFTRVCSYEEWIGAGDARRAYRDKLHDRLKNFLIGLKSSLDRVVGYPEWKHEARSLLDRVSTQFGALTTFIESFYQSLTSVSKFSNERAWRLVGRCVGAVFEIQLTHRSEALMVEHPETLKGKTAVIGAVLKSHQMINEFVNVGFTAHPELVKELTTFMLTERVDPEQLDTAQRKLRSLEGSVATLQLENTALRELTTTLKKSLGDLQNDFKTFKGTNKGGGGGKKKKGNGANNNAASTTNNSNNGGNQE